VGQLFRFDKRSRKKTNLLVFLRPVVLRSAEASWNLTADRYDFVRRLQADIALPAHNVLPDFTSTALPPMTPRPEPASSSMRGFGGGNPSSIAPGAAAPDSGAAGATGSAGSSLPEIVPGLSPRSSGLVLPPEPGLLLQ
jgi:general secretion pathway protein D